MCHHSELVSTFSSEPTCLIVSSDGELMVVGTTQGMLHVINAHTGQVQYELSFLFECTFFPHSATKWLHRSTSCSVFIVSV